LRRAGSGNSGVNTSHCSSINNFCCFLSLMAEAQQTTPLTRKYLA
jgi:hypothetical protein